ncbi:MAG: sigma-70 family RNA polymerase sigma factor [Erysipelotrichaceae bacterium]
MGYNYAKEVVKWKNWKKQEEEILRTLGVNEDVIKQLHEYDWEVLKSERRIKRSQNTTLESFFLHIPFYDKKEIKTIDDLLDEIENEALFNYLRNTDRVTLVIVLLKTMGYSTFEISEILNLSSSSIYKRVQRLRKKFKKS